MKFNKIIQTIDTHTFGGPTRNVVTGVPKLKGNTMSEKQAYFQKHYDWIRTTVMLEPRGGNVMSGTIVTSPCDKDADVGIIFIDSGGYFPMCGHSTIGLTTMLVETGMISATEPDTLIKIDTPAGIITANAIIKNGSVEKVIFQNIPCFLYKSKVLNFGRYGDINVDVVYGGGSFVLIPSVSFDISLTANNIPQILMLSKMILKIVNKQIDFKHPLKPHITGISQVHWYSEPITNKNVDARSVNVFPPGIDRSPCGTGTSARAVAKFVKGELALNEEFSQESLTNGIFTAKVIKPTMIGKYKGGIPTLSGSAYITGFHQFVIDPDDSLGFGFQL